MPAPMSLKNIGNMSREETDALGQYFLDTGIVMPEEVVRQSPLNMQASPNVDPPAPMRRGSSQDGRKTLEDFKRIKTRDIYESPEAQQARFSAMAESPQFQEERRGLADLENMLNMQRSQERPEASWLKPVAALVDSETGSKLSSGLTGETQTVLNARHMGAMSELQKRKAELNRSISGSLKDAKVGSDMETFSRQLAEMTGSSGAKAQGETSVDRAFAKEYVDFIPGGGYAAIQQNLDQMGDIVNSLNTKDGLTGPTVGTIPKQLRDLVMPSSGDLQDRYEQIVQQSLKRILGAQFTQEEAKQLIQRSFNPRLDQATNAKRILSVQKELREAAEAKADASRYFEDNGFSMRGYTGTTRVKIGEKEYNIDPSAKKSSSPVKPKALSKPTAQWTPQDQAEVDQYEKDLGGG